MPTLRITVQDPPSEFSDYGEIKLLLEMPMGLADPGSHSGRDLIFEVPFELKPDRSEILQPSGPLIQRQNDGRRFVYLNWLGRQNGESIRFRRLKIFFDKVHGFPGSSERYETRIMGVDKKGGPACATAQVLN